MYDMLYKCIHWLGLACIDPGLSPDRLQPAGVTGGKSAVEFDKRLLAESMNPLRLHFPHGRLK